jgi:hypothetical protein
LTLALALWTAGLASASIAPPAGAGEPGRAKVSLAQDAGHLMAAAELLRQPLRGKSTSDDPESEPPAPSHAAALAANTTAVAATRTKARCVNAAEPPHTPYAPRGPPLLAT